MTEIETPITLQNVEGLKLTKNTKGYNWEIKTIGIDIDRLNKLNMEMIRLYGEQQYN